MKRANTCSSARDPAAYRLLPCATGCANRREQYARRIRVFPEQIELHLTETKTHPANPGGVHGRRKKTTEKRRQSVGARRAGFNESLQAPEILNLRARKRNPHAFQKLAWQVQQSGFPNPLGPQCTTLSEPPSRPGCGFLLDPGQIRLRRPPLGSQPSLVRIGPGSSCYASPGLLRDARTDRSPGRPHTTCGRNFQLRCCDQQSCRTNLAPFRSSESDHGCCLGQR